MSSMTDEEDVACSATPEHGAAGSHLDKALPNCASANSADGYADAAPTPDDVVDEELTQGVLEG